MFIIYYKIYKLLFLKKIYYRISYIYIYLNKYFSSPSINTNESIHNNLDIDII